MAVVALVVTFFRPVPVRGSPEFDFDPIFNIPRPPQDAPFPKTSVIIEQVVMTVSGLLGVLMGGLDAYRAKSLLPLMLPISGAFIAFPEMLLDVVGGLYHPWGPGYWSVKFLGREIVPWISVWFGYGALMQYNLVLLEKNVKTKTLWFYWGIMVLADLIIEEIFLPLGAWIYYGNQPLRVGSLPWWWLPCNSVGVFLATAIAFRFKHHLRGWKALVVLITTPASVGATYGAIALPCWYAVNGDYPWLVTQILGLITMVLGLGLFCLILQILLGRRPFEFDEKCAEDAWEPIAPEQPYHD
ncbi:hypothetical protein MBLNU459_g0817t1 [Dothideomycetes sp. NU459]